GIDPLFEKEGKGEIFRMLARRASQQIPLNPPFSKGEGNSNRGKLECRAHFGQTWDKGDSVLTPHVATAASIICVCEKKRLLDERIRECRGLPGSAPENSPPTVR